MNATSCRAHILVLNFNGRRLLDECLPSVVAAAASAPFECKTTIVDNDSTDGSREYLLEHWPEVGVVHSPNLGLASFNQTLLDLDEPVVLLLNNDVRLDPCAVEPLVQAVQNHPDALFSAPLCWNRDGSTYEGMRTRVRFHRGLVQGMSRVPGLGDAIHEPDLTAAAGPVLAVHRQRFLALGGYDPLYHPGRIEDLDLGYRGWLANWKGYYVPESVAYHHGCASFEPAFGKAGSDLLALRNTLLFIWKNVRGRRLFEHFAWIPARLLHAAATGRLSFPLAFVQACSRWFEWRGQIEFCGHAGATQLARQESFFERFHW